MIIGGLIAIAVLALLGAFLASRGGNTSAKVTAAAAVPAGPVTPAAIEKQETMPAPELEKSMTLPLSEHERKDQQLSARSQPLEQLDFPEAPTMAYAKNEHTNNIADYPTREEVLPVSWATEQSAQSQYSEREIATLNRQLYELAGQLHILQRQSRDIEQGLVQLSGVIEGMHGRNSAEQSANGIPSAAGLHYRE
ncbi:hypothetical protein [Dictyobacter arantiisoli]|uniref:Uncharacterized protein n=1 Tax=Dictyobacter arantiisoli TaxID=2014874 RepID=A0A5A5TH07_9CHLR|nr:hypothetical protein [Dictyobacter arantiisoli]GCF10244.1 hypothetical protein KDI_38080 [Dictyobacter arantiisoli]